MSLSLKISLLVPLLLTAIFAGVSFAAENSFESTWNTNWGEMRLKQESGKVTGTYTHDSGRIDATVSGSSLKGRWSEAPSYKEPGDAGDVELKMSEDGKSFTGYWRYGSEGNWNGDWTGTRASGDLKLNIPEVVPESGQSETEPVANEPTVPQNAQELLFDTTPKYIGACSLTDKASWVLDKDLNVTMVQFWYNWSAGETILDFTITKGGQEFVKGSAKRSSCDPYQRSWCNASFSVNKVFPKGSYASKVSAAKQCLKPGGTGTVRLYGPSEQPKTPAVLETPVVTSTASLGTSDWFAGKCQGSTPMLYVEDRTLQSGSKARLPVMVCNASNLSNMDLEVSYDPAILSFISTDKGSLNSSSMLQSNAKDGRVKVSYAQNGGSSGNGSVAYVNFNVAGSSGASTKISPTVNSAKDSSGSNFDPSVKDGTFTVGQNIKGDCDGDGLVSSRDALAALQMAVEKVEVNLCYDVTGDGKVDSSDAREILKKAVGK
jgi:hypothetical protein